MRIIVTGGAGRVGRYVVEALASCGHDVVSVDLERPDVRLDDVRYMQGDVTRAEDMFGIMAFSKPEALIHLAAWPDPGIVSDNRTYADNVTGAFNVLTAAEAFAVKRTIMTSSAQVYGFEHTPPVIAPVTESHPLRPSNSYALSKVAGEDAAAYFAQRGNNILTFRIMGVRTPEQMPAERKRVASNPDKDLRLLWTRVDARDIAAGYRQAIETNAVPSGIYNLSGDTISADEDVRVLLGRTSPGTDISALPHGKTSPLSCQKAASAFSYKPKFSC